MQSSAATPADFLARLEPDWRRDTLEQLGAIIRREAIELDESMHDKMLGYSVDGDFIFHLNEGTSGVRSRVARQHPVDSPRSDTYPAR